MPGGDKHISSMRKNSLTTYRLACAMVATMVTVGIASPSAHAQEPSPRPTLVVGIFVEGLSADYINLLRSNFGDNGFNRLLNNGVSIENVDYGPGIDATAATAILVSGASPAVNGIPAARVWDTATKIDYPILLDPDKIGNYSEQALTPNQLLVSTISDEVRITDGGIGLVHAIAADPQIAIILGGHAGNSSYWISDITGKWTTSRHYRENPAPIARRNVGFTLPLRLDTLTWEPALKLYKYPDLPDYKKLYPFRHTFPAKQADRFKAFKTSAPANREIASAAADYISTLQLGSRGVTDMLSVGFNVSPYMNGRGSDTRIETMDAYVRLDSDIANIIKAIEKGPGMGQTLLFVAGTPAPAGSKRDDERWNIPSGQFSPRRAISLLNMYLMAIHGNGEWVNGYHNGYFYLNTQLLKERGLSEVDMRREAAEFLARMSGVSDVYTLDDILARRAGDDPSALRRNVSASHAGDLLVMVNPGWEISDKVEGETVNIDQSQLPVVRWQASTSPIYILSPDLETAKISDRVDARAIAPTITRQLRIRSPNAASISPLNIKR